ncbi:VWA domain-containing protein [Actinoplanes sp. NPDC023936]|uniref:VWA domain-containing protein n=1 Tax=Actinoplanes sp. NPDC023936 TaxID=3154910 RepID=UPI00340FB3C2
MRRGPAVLALGVLLVSATACTPAKPEPISLRVLASSELADMTPILADLRRETGIELVMDHQGTVAANKALDPANYRHDLAWLSDDRYLKLTLDAAGYAGPMPLSTRIMGSPVAIGVKPSVAARLGDPTWADIAGEAAAGDLTFAMADPGQAASGLAALIGVATAATGEGRALRPEDVTCDRLGGFFSGQTLTAPTSAALVDTFVAAPDKAQALIGYESVLLALNASGRLTEPLEIRYPRDGIVLSEYPLMLLRPEHRAAYDRVVTWLTSDTAQQKIMRQTLRRPMNPAVTRDQRLTTPIGNSLYFPDRQDVIDRLLANYRADPGRPGHVIFVLDFSGSMKGERMNRLRSAFNGLSGVDRTPSGKFTRFHRGEKITLIRFGEGVLDERTFTVDGDDDVRAMRAFLAPEEYDERTAVWSALGHAYQKARAEPGRKTSIVLMTDGESNAGIGLPGFLAEYRALPAPVRAVPAYMIGVGEADGSALRTAAAATGGRAAAATTDSLADAFKDVRGCG